MRNAFTILTASAVMAGTVFAQEAAEGIDDILNELGAGQAVESHDSVAVATVMDHSRDLYVGGQFEKALQGFKSVVAQDPSNVEADLYITKIEERNQRMINSSVCAADVAWGTGLVQRSYTFGGDILQKMGLEGVEGSVDVSSRFPEVTFPEGSVAVYQPKLEKIFVRNTRENLAVMEEVLDALDVSKHASDIEQVEIEAKFVEVSEGTLEELGFQWNLDGAASADDYSADDGVDGLFSDALRTDAFSDTASDGDGLSSASGTWAAYDIEDSFTSAGTMSIESAGSTPLELMISALDQSSKSDVLSAPRILTQSGEEAVMRVGELHLYPEVYEGGLAQGSMLQVDYQDFEEKLLGVELSVTPEVDGDQIMLMLNPRITELAGWQSYQLAPEDYMYTHRQGAKKMYFSHDAVIAQLPIFKKREIETEVTIADGGTIGMGGLISEDVESYEDKVPVLGSLPLVGRLFRNEGEQIVKRNLMMFVSAKTVAPSGRVKTDRSFE